MEAAAQIFCPECGAPAPFRGTAVSLVCEYCGSTVVRSGADVALIGKVSAVVDTGSPILLDARGEYGNVPFSIDGRLQVEYARGTWNEWFLSFADGSVGWLADAQGSYSIVRPRGVEVVADKVPDFHSIEAGGRLTIDGVEYVVTDKRGASYKGAEGILPFDARPGLTFFGVDLRGYAGEFMTLDYGTDGAHTRPVPYIGQSVDLTAIKLHPLRRFEGWPRD